MLGEVFDMLFGCWHKNYSFPITAKKGNGLRSQAARLTGTYVVCLDCGKEFPYDWNHMKVLSAEPEFSGSEYTEAARLTADAAGYKVA
jgi:hypothetical protein